MRGLLCCHGFNAFVARVSQVHPFEPRFPPAEQNPRDGNMQFVDEAFAKILPYGVRAAANPHVLLASSLARTVQSLANASCYEAKW